MRYLRWYDKDKYLSSFMSLLQGLDEELQEQVAVEILLNIPGGPDADFADFTHIIADYDPRKYHRWYDKNPTVHTAVEAIKKLDPITREELLGTISDIIVKYSDEEAGFDKYGK